MHHRPSVSVVVPFAGSPQELERLQIDLASLRTREGDEVIIADNRGWHAAAQQRAEVKITAARGVRTPAFARNCGAQIATGRWLVFIDADTQPTPTLLDDYFDPPPASTTAILAGEVLDVVSRPTLVSRHGVARARMSQRLTLTRSGTPYAQTANCAVLRDAFQTVGGFEPQARAGEDADLCFRLQRAGWLLEQRPRAAVAHRSRDAFAPWLVQLARHGSGAAWLNRRWTGEFPPSPPLQLAKRLLRNLLESIRAALHGDREAAAFALLDLAGACAFELGRLGHNRPRNR